MDMDRQVRRDADPDGDRARDGEGAERTTTRKFFPGYMFVQMELTEATYHLVKNTPEDHRLPRRHNPQPVPEKEIQPSTSR